MEKLLENSQIPDIVVYNDRRHLTISKMYNHHTRALLLPNNGGAPIWVSNKQLIDILNKKA